MIADAVARAVDGEHLDATTMEGAMHAVLAGEASEAHIAALAVALRMKGETAEEIAAAARVMRRHCVEIRPDVAGPLVDTCGTGGDRSGTFNISTVAALVVAACGVPVAKHGNRAVSSSAGSADVLEALGIRLEQSPEAVTRCIEDLGIGFLFAPAHHGTLKHAVPVRRALGLRTFFNLLGPLSNPAGATHQVVGVYDEARVRQLADVLHRLGVHGAWVVHGAGGLDEVSPVGRTRVAWLADGAIEELTVEPRDFGVEPVSVEAITGGDAQANAATARSVLQGERGGPRTAVALNAAAALCAAGVVRDLRKAAERALDAIDSGAAAGLLEQWARRTREP